MLLQIIKGNHEQAFSLDLDIKTEAGCAIMLKIKLALESEGEVAGKLSFGGKDEADND